MDEHRLYVVLSSYPHEFFVDKELVSIDRYTALILADLCVLDTISDVYHVGAIVEWGDGVEDDELVGHVELPEETT